MEEPATYSPESSVKSKPETDTFDKGDTASYDVKFGTDNMDEPPETAAIGSPFRGMGKEELLHHSTKPFWWRLRMACISVVLLGWLALLITVVALVLVYPRCRDQDTRSWWQKETVYRVYVRSFCDSNGDGVGDLKGIESKLGHIKNLGANTISVSTIYQSDHVIDSDFNVIDHMNIDSDYGNMDDFRSLLKAIHQRGMHMVMDFIPNHTSDLHPWFVNSSVTSDRTNEYRNYYVWTDTPTNWRSVYNNASWTTSGQRNQNYLHQFLSSEPDLNLRSSQVQADLEEILRFWLTEGVDGFYIRNSGFMFEDYDLRDEMKSSSSNITDPNEYAYYDHAMTYGLPEVYDMLARWRTLVEEYSNSTKERLLMADISGDLGTVMRYYGHYERDGVHIALNDKFLSENADCGAPCIKEYVTDWMANLPENHWANWVIGNEDSTRLGSKFNASYIRAFLTTVMLLPGTPIVYYGDEILMMDTVVTSEPWTREQGMRGLMQWENDTYGGFCSPDPCTASPWIPSDDNYVHNNIKDQNMTSGSIMNLFKSLTSLRKETTFLIGEFSTVVADDHIFSFVREFDGEKGYLIAINFSPEDQTRDYYANHGTMEKAATVELTTGSDVGYAVEDEVDTELLHLGPYHGVVVSWDYVAKEL